MNVSTRSVFALVVVLSAVGCECGSPTGLDPRAIVVEPATLSVTAGGPPAALTARRISGEDVTALVTWSSSDEAVARVEGGVVSGLAPGNLVITATLETFTGTAEVRVNAPDLLAPSCADGAQNGAETDLDCGGSSCPACATGAACAVGGDCASGVCTEAVCQAATCFDGVRNGAETGLDCGGTSCSPCGSGGGCATGADCASSVCTAGVCVAANCTDGVLNGAETDLDCGGPGCAACASGGGCREGSDCASGICTAGVCVAATCSDGQLNGAETAPDCGGPGCPACPPGLDCAQDSDCASRLCAGGTCQAPSCTDAVLNGAETGLDCGGPSCGDCETGVACGNEGDCLSRVCTGGICQAPSCTDEVRNGAETGLDCGGGACPLCGNGNGCSGGADCASGVCAQGVCVSPGCTDGAKNGQETDLDCGGPDCADCGAGQGCTTGDDCASSVCTGNLCQAASCTDGVRNGAETATDCGGGACPACGAGLACSLDADCASGNCANGSCGAPTVSSVSVSPAVTTVPVGRAQPFTATALRSDGTRADVTATASWTSSDATTAVISGAGVLQALVPGTTTVRAVYGGVTSSGAAVTVIARALDRLELTPVAVSLPIGLRQAYEATGLYSDGSIEDLTAAVTWASSAPTVATISSTGLATATGAGTTQITASLAGVTGATDLVVTSTTVTALSVSPARLTLPVGVRATLVATALLSDGSARDVTDQAGWSSADAAVATITTRGLVTAERAGTVTLTATLAGHTGSGVLTVIDATLFSIQVFPADQTVPRGFELRYGAVGLYSDGNAYDLTLTATWSSTAPAVASVSNTFPDQGLVKTLQLGSTQLHATLGGLDGATSLTVNGATLAALSLTPALVTLPIGAPRQYLATGVFSDGTARDVTALARWQTGNLAVASISNAARSPGLLTSVGAGTTTVTASLGGQLALGRVTVTSAILERLSLSPPSARIGLEAVVPFTATAVYSDGTAIDVTEFAAWTSSDVGIAVVRNDTGFRGLTLGLSAGEATISATYSGQVASAALTVTHATLLDLYISPAVVRTGVGIDVQFSASGVWTDGTTSDLTRVTTWTSSLSSVAVISNVVGSHGLATTRGVGVTTIGAAWAGRTDETTLTASDAAMTALTVTPSITTTGLGGQVQYRALATFDDGTTFDVTTIAAWSASSNTVASISGAPGSVGLATALGAGSTRITAQVGPVAGTATLTVTGAPLVNITISPTTAIIPVAYWRPWTATAHYADGVSSDVTALATWTTGTPTVASAGNGAIYGGRISGLRPGTSSVIARFGGFSATASATVLAMELIAVVVTPEDPVTGVGVPVQLTATGTFTDQTTTLALDITLQVGWKVAPKKNGTVSNTDGSRGLVTMYNPSSAANILAQAYEPRRGDTVTGNTKVIAP